MVQIDLYLDEILTDEPVVRWFEAAGDGEAHSVVGQKIRAIVDWMRDKSAGTGSIYNGWI
jgi:hypothetical protein